MKDQFYCAEIKLIVRAPSRETATQQLQTLMGIPVECRADQSERVREAGQDLPDLVDWGFRRNAEGERSFFRPVEVDKEYIELMEQVAKDEEAPEPALEVEAAEREERSKEYEQEFDRI